jgi:hypothetical protein
MGKLDQIKAKKVLCSPDIEVEKMRRLSEYLGISFQIDYDIIDMDPRKITKNLRKAKEIANTITNRQKMGSLLKMCSF